MDLTVSGEKASDRNIFLCNTWPAELLFSTIKAVKFVSEIETTIASLASQIWREVEILTLAELLHHHSPRMHSPEPSLCTSETKLTLERRKLLFEFVCFSFVLPPVVVM